MKIICPECGRVDRYFLRVRTAKSLIFDENKIVSIRWKTSNISVIFFFVFSCSIIYIIYTVI